MLMARIRNSFKHNLSLLFGSTEKYKNTGRLWHSYFRRDKGAQVPVEPGVRGVQAAVLRQLSGSRHSGKQFSGSRSVGTNVADLEFGAFLAPGSGIILDG
jgi:hypothetical protein